MHTRTFFSRASAEPHMASQAPQGVQGNLQEGQIRASTYIHAFGTMLVSRSSAARQLSLTRLPMHHWALRVACWRDRCMHAHSRLGDDLGITFCSCASAESHKAFKAPQGFQGSPQEGQMHARTFMPMGQCSCEILRLGPS